ncbi:glycosyltransferase family 8 protein [Microbacterium caowuchunii]|uniref:Glycosyltransferase family 8 protein n=1 Tax=Microbacterium caowuchunii TaxID=2614638 RepID=A0A5N0TMY0_9MICO|nr:glycosyltransferase family 8 protein [Microbacterium caowuchunii]KAA9135537.1 glycosyltransferase family 8 protein [Microbacterium caowuchunii]
MTPEGMTVVMCVDRAFVVPLAVGLASMDGSASGRVTVYVMHPGLSDETRDRVTRPLSRLIVKWIDVPPERVAGAHFSVFLSEASLYRLLLGELLPESVERVLYIDADVVIADDVLPLTEVELYGATVAAVRESQSPWAAGPLGPPWRELGLRPDAAYFNSGVMLIDVRRWRQRDIGRRALEVLRTSSPRWGDQDALNTALQDDWIELPRRWNLQSADLRGETASWALWRADVEDAVADPAIVHYTERDKPWDPRTAHPLAALWRSHLDRTDWAGWRAVVPRPSIWERGGRTLLHAARSALARRESSPFPE